MWSTAGPLVNPVAGVVLADTGALPLASQLTRVILGGSGIVIAQIEHRNAANTANISAQIVSTPASVTEVFDLGEGAVSILAANERFRVTVVTTVVGTCQASIISL